MDTVDPMESASVNGYKFNTTFTDRATGFVLSYGHVSTSEIPDIQEFLTDYTGKAKHAKHVHRYVLI